MKKLLSVVLLAAAALLGGCAGKSDTDVNAPISTETKAVPGADCSKLNGLSVKLAKYQQNHDPIGWSHLAFNKGLITSVPEPGMPALTSYTCKSAVLNGLTPGWDFELSTNIGDVEVSYRPNEFEPTQVTWSRSSNPNAVDYSNNYIKG
jgi:hypothetical protein